MHVETLVIGAGFAGLSVASMLDSGRCLVVDGGAPYDVLKVQKNYRYEKFQHRFGLYSPEVDAEIRALCGNHDYDLPLSGFSANVHSRLMGGNSNWWGGRSDRLAAETFSQSGVIAWPFGIDILLPYYVDAERVLGVHGQNICPYYASQGEQRGSQSWLNWAATYFPEVYVTPKALNYSIDFFKNRGICSGELKCGVCPNDAKARPANVFPEIESVPGSGVTELLFEGERAVAVKGTAGEERFQVDIDRVVLAAGGIDNVSILHRSILPSGVRRSFIGAHYQDHTCAEIVVHFHDALPRGSEVGSLMLTIPELSGSMDGVSFVSTLVSKAPEINSIVRGFPDFVVSRNEIKLENAYSRVGSVYVQIEVPPEWRLSLLSKNGRVAIDTLPYLENLWRIDNVLNDILLKLKKSGLEVIDVLPHYRSAFGGHHYVGTTAMSNGAYGVVDADQRLIGTENVFVNGASVIPRCGGYGPTLTVVALGLKLGKFLENIG